MLSDPQTQTQFRPKARLDRIQITATQKELLLLYTQLSLLKGFDIGWIDIILKKNSVDVKVGVFIGTTSPYLYQCRTAHKSHNQVYTTNCTLSITDHSDVYDMPCRSPSDKYPAALPSTAW